MTVQKFYTPPQLAELFLTSVQALATDRMNGVGVPYVKIGNRVRYDAEDVAAYIEANKVQTGGAA